MTYLFYLFGLFDESIATTCKAVYTIVTGSKIPVEHMIGVHF